MTFPEKPGTNLRGRPDGWQCRPSEFDHAKASVDPAGRRRPIRLARQCSKHPAHTRRPKACSDQFKAADLNNDGVLSRTEIGNAKQTLPSSLANQDRITRKQFMAVCSKGASKS